MKKETSFLVLVVAVRGAEVVGSAAMECGTRLTAVESVRSVSERWSVRVVWRLAERRRVEDLNLSERECNDGDGVSLWLFSRRKRCHQPLRWEWV